MPVMYNNNYTCCEIGNKIENVSIKCRPFNVKSRINKKCQNSESRNPGV